MVDGGAPMQIAICGAGPVGLTLAALLVKAGLPPESIALIDAKPLEKTVDDPRSIALSYGSRQILEHIGVWPLDAGPRAAFAARAVQEIHQIHVSQKGRFGRTLMDRADYALPALGYVTRYGTLVENLTKVVQQSGVNLLRPAKVTTLVESAEQVSLTLSNQQILDCALVVQAEGGVFTEQTAKAVRKDYDQIAIVAHVNVSAPLPHCAFERFTGEGPLALLPQDDGYSLVWCVRPATAERLRHLSDTDFLAELQSMFGFRLGRFTGATPRNQYPLGLNAGAVSAPASTRTVAIGNAAQTLHPVAGQGFNLGLRDVKVLASLLTQQATPAALTRFVAARQSDRAWTIRLTDLMARAFTLPPAQVGLGIGLSVLDVLPVVKRTWVEQMVFGRR